MEAPPDVTPPENLPFSFGAAGLTPIWLMFHGRAGSGWLLVLFGLPLRLLQEFGIAGIITALTIRIVIQVVAGMQGSKIAWLDRGYRSVDDLEKSEKWWSSIGIFICFIEAMIVFIGLLSLSNH